MVESRNERLAREYREMLKIQDRPYLNWIPIKGEIPYVEEYLLNVRLRSYVLTAEDGRYLVGVQNRWTIKVSLRGSYPHVAPYIRMLNIPPVFHPFWYSKGTYCAPDQWRSETPLKDHILKMLASLKYDPDAIMTDTPANYKALEWAKKNQDQPGLFPSDGTILNENNTDEIKESSLLEIIDSWGAGQ